MSRRAVRLRLPMNAAELDRWEAAVRDDPGLTADERTLALAIAADARAAMKGGTR